MTFRNQNPVRVLIISVLHRGRHSFCLVLTSPCARTILVVHLFITFTLCLCILRSRRLHCSNFTHIISIFVDQRSALSVCP